MKIFLGIASSLSIKNKISNIQKKLTNKSIYKVDKKDFHITLIPPFEIEAENIDKINSKIQKVVNNFIEFDLIFKYIEVLKDNRKERGILWLRAEDNKNLFLLKSKLEKMLNIKEQNNIYKPHITIAKFNLNNPILTTQIKTKVKWKEKINNVTIYKSKVDSKIKNYITLKKVKISKK